MIGGTAQPHDEAGVAGAAAPSRSRWYWHVATKDDLLDLALDAILCRARTCSRAPSSWRGAQDPSVLHRVREHAAARADLYPTLSGSGFVERSRWTEDELFDHSLGRPLDTVLG